MSARSLRVSGRVQGVGFRAFVVRTARQLGVRGGVRNDADGGVTVAAEGAAEALDDLARRLAQGPPAARVRAVEARELDRLPPSEPFDVRF